MGICGQRERERESGGEGVHNRTEQNRTEETRSWDLHVFIAERPATMDHANPLPSK